MIPSIKYNIKQPNIHRGIKTWYGVERQKGKRPKLMSLKTNSKKEANAWLEKQNAQKFLPGSENNTEEMKISNAIKKYHEHLKAVHSNVERTYTTYLNYLTKFERFKCKKEYVSEFTFEDAQNYINHLSLKLSPKTVNEHFKFMRNAFDRWIDYKYTSFNPFNKKKIKTPKIMESEKPFWTLEEIQEILSIAPDHMVPFWTTLAHTGIRFDESMKLKFCHIDFENKEMKVFGKGGKIRHIPLTDTLYQIFIEEKAKYKHGKCFPDIPSTEQGCLAILKKSLKGIKFIQDGENNHHRFRHSVASNLLRNKANIKSVQNLLGHKHIKTTLDTYGHLIPNDLKITIKILDK